MSIASLFCKHDYELISEVTTKSRYEHAFDVAAAYGANDVKHTLDLERKFIQVLVCNKCGNVKRYSTVI